MQKWKCRYAPSLGPLEGSPDKVWGTEPYNPVLHENEPTVFFGLYGLKDFFSLWQHKGRKAILWAGSDITHFVNGYWLDENGYIRISPEGLAQWINQECENFVENTAEQDKLMSVGIRSKITPSFMGDVEEYEENYLWSERPKVYLSVSSDNFETYGWNVVERIADKCDVDFYLYGSNNWKTKHKNVFIQGRVPKERMNNEVQRMQAGLRLNKHDGFSEILAKSILWGQHPISRIPYPHIDTFVTEEELIQCLNNLVNKDKPNSGGRKYYLENLNKYPWVSKQQNNI